MPDQATATLPPDPSQQYIPGAPDPLYGAVLPTRPVTAQPAATGQPQQAAPGTGVGGVPANRAEAYQPWSLDKMSDYIGRNDATAFTPDQAHGVARWMHDRESKGGDPFSYNAAGGGAGAYGEGQWRGTRQRELVTLYGATPSVPNQLDYLAREFLTTEKAAFQAIKGTRTEQEAYEAMGKFYERPGPPKGLMQAGASPDYQNIVARSQQIADQERAEITRLTAEADKADPGSQERRQRLQQAMDHSERLMQNFEYQSQHPPTETPLDMMQNFGSLATVIALAGGLFAKRPLTAALNAAGSAMRAQQEGNHEQAQRAYQVWQDQTELISKALNFQNQEINQIMEDRRLSEAERREKIAEHLQLNQMQLALDQWNIGNLADVYKLIAAQPKIALEMDQIKKHMALMEAQTEALHGGKGWQILTEPVNRDEAGNPIQYRYNPNTGEATTLTGQPYTPSGAEKLAPGYAPRSAPAIYLQAYMRENPKALPNEITEAMGEFRRIQALETGFASGVLGRQVIALNTVADHLLLVKEYAEALNNNKIPRANQIANQISKEAGGPEVTNFEAGRDIMADEVVRLLTTTGGTEADRSGMQSRISSAFSPQQFAGVINVFQRFVHGRFEALEQQYAQGDAKRAKRFNDDILTDKSRKVYGAADDTPSSRETGAGASLDVTPEQYEKLPSGAAYTIPGKPGPPMYKP